MPKRNIKRDYYVIIILNPDDMTYDVFQTNKGEVIKFDTAYQADRFGMEGPYAITTPHAVMPCNEGDFKKVVPVKRIYGSDIFGDYEPGKYVGKNWRQKD